MVPTTSSRLCFKISMPIRAGSCSGASCGGMLSIGTRRTLREARALQANRVGVEERAVALSVLLDGATGGGVERRERPERDRDLRAAPLVLPHARDGAVDDEHRRDPARGARDRRYVAGGYR